MRKNAIIALGLCFTASAYGQDDINQYVCTVDLAVGVHYSPESNSWQPWRFPTYQKYLLRHLVGLELQGRYVILRDGEPMLAQLQFHSQYYSKWGLFPFGSNIPYAVCDEEFRCNPDATFFLHFNKGSGRFEVSSISGYVKEVEKTNTIPDDGSVQIGNCTPL